MSWAEASKFVNDLKSGEIIDLQRAIPHGLKPARPYLLNMYSLGPNDDPENYLQRVVEIVNQVTDPENDDYDFERVSLIWNVSAPEENADGTWDAAFLFHMTSPIYDILDAKIDNSTYHVAYANSDPVIGFDCEIVSSDADIIPSVMATHPTSTDISPYPIKLTEGEFIYDGNPDVTNGAYLDFVPVASAYTRYGSRNGIDNDSDEWNLMPFTSLTVLNAAVPYKDRNYYGMFAVVIRCRAISAQSRKSDWGYFEFRLPTNLKGQLIEAGSTIEGSTVTDITSSYLPGWGGFDKTEFEKGLYSIDMHKSVSVRFWRYTLSDNTDISSGNCSVKIKFILRVKGDSIADVGKNGTLPNLYVGTRAYANINGSIVESSKVMNIINLGDENADDNKVPYTFSGTREYNALTNTYSIDGYYVCEYDATREFKNFAKNPTYIEARTDLECVGSSNNYGTIEAYIPQPPHWNPGIFSLYSPGHRVLAIEKSSS